MPLTGDPIALDTLPQLRAHRGRLLPDDSPSGSAVYAAAFLRHRKIIFESALLSTPETFRLIVIHELFHFAWPRLSNHARLEFRQILATEWDSRAQGELGESSEVMKIQLRQNGLDSLSRQFGSYVCESFCDTAAWLYAGVAGHSWFTLRKRWLARRQFWFQSLAAKRPWKC
jgi:hypothetical protein